MTIVTPSGHRSVNTFGLVLADVIVLTALLKCVCLFYPRAVPRVFGLRLVRRLVIPVLGDGRIFESVLIIFTPLVSMRFKGSGISAPRV